MSLKIEVPQANKPNSISYSANTTPIKNLEDDDDANEDDDYSTPLPPKLNALSISVDNIDPPESKLHHRHSRRSRNKFNLENNTSREAGHTPPPRHSNHNVSRFSDLVRDTDKREGPVNWWGLKLKMPGDNTMKILSPHRIPVPTTPTTPEYIVKTPDGLRVSLLDIDIDDEKRLTELGVDDEKKEYIMNLKKEQEKLEEKEKQDKLTQLDNNNSSESDSTPDEFTAKHHAKPNQILAVMSQPIGPTQSITDHKTRKRSKTPHDPSTPTLVAFDWETIVAERGDDPFSLMDQFAIANNTMTQEFYVGRISLQDMRLYQSARASNSANAMYRGISQPTGKNRAHSFKAQAPARSQRPLLMDRNSRKRHSEIIRSNTERPKKDKQQRRKSSRRKLRVNKSGHLQRSASVDGPNKGKMLKDRTKKNKRNSSVHKLGKKGKKRKKPPKSEILTSRRPPRQQLDSLDALQPMDLGAESIKYSNSARKVRFKPTVQNDEEQEEVVLDLINDILHTNNDNKIQIESLGATPISIQSTKSNISITSMDDQDPDIDEELQAPNINQSQIKNAFGLKLTLDTSNVSSKADSVTMSMPIIQMPNINMKSANIPSVDDMDHTKEEKEELEEEEDDEDEEEYEDDTDETSYDYEEHRYDSSSGSFSDNPGPLKNPFAIDIQELIANDDGNNVDDDDECLPSKIAMPVGSNQLHLGDGGAVFIADDGEIVQNGAETVSHRNGRNLADKHLASSPLIMNNDDAVSAFFAQYIPAYYTANPWILSPTFEIAQYKDLKNLNLFIYKTLRLLEKDDTNHPTQPRNIKMKSGLEWDLRIDGIASCYISETLVTNVIHFVSFPRYYDEYNAHKKKGKKHLLGLIKSTQSLVIDPVSPVTTKLKNGYSTNSNMMANSVTHTPRSARTSGTGTATGTGGSRRNTGNIKINLDEKLKHLSVNPNNNNASATNTPNEEYYDNESDHDDNLLIAAGGAPHDRDHTCCCRSCCNIHNLRHTLIFNHNKCKNVCHRLIYALFYTYGDSLLFLLIYFAILTFAVCERIYFPLLPYNELNLLDLNDDILVSVSNYIVIITGRIMLISMILMFISRMMSFQSLLVDVFANRSRFILNFLCYPYIHLILSWFGIFTMMFIHIICAYLSHTDSIYIYDIFRIVLAFISGLCIILSNCGGTYYSLYSLSVERMKHNKYVSICSSILCNITFDYGQQKKRYKLLHILSGCVLLIVFYLDINYIGVYYVLTVFLLLFVVDRLVFLFNRSKSICSSDLNIIPIDHQFKLLFVNNNESQMVIEPGDIFYVSSKLLGTFGRPSVFFSKNNYHSIGCIMRVHRNNTLSHNMERIKYNFTFLESILDNEITPIFRGPYRCNSIYHRLISNINCNVFTNHRYIQYLIAVDEGISYQIEYLTYLQSHNYSKMPYPTHIIFATTSKALFNYITTNLQLLFIEMEDLTVECKLLPSNINLIPNVEEMVDYYKNERIKKLKKKQKQQQKDNENDKDEIEIEMDINISANDIMQEMEYDILHYLSIPHILYHHNLKTYYENHRNSKLSTKLHEKYENNRDSDDDNDDDDDGEEEKDPKDEFVTVTTAADSPKPYDLHDDIEIEMYYSGIPFVSNCLNNVCKICRIPYYTQHIY